MLLLTALWYLQKWLQFILDSPYLSLVPLLSVPVFSALVLESAISLSTPNSFLLQNDIRTKF
jgi:hypothetical protein